MDTSKKAITSLFFCEQDFFFRDYMPFRVKTNDSHQRDNIKKSILCQTVVKKTKSKDKKNSFSSIIEGDLIYFFKDFFLADCFRLDLLTFRCVKHKRKLYFF